MRQAWLWTGMAGTAMDACRPNLCLPRCSRASHWARTRRLLEAPISARLSVETRPDVAGYSGPTGTLPEAGRRVGAA